MKNTYKIVITAQLTCHSNKLAIVTYNSTYIIYRHYQSMAISPTVLIIGCGIAGPVLANFYKRKGYNPIVFEKVRELGDAGASLLLMPNG